jgi:hypothetical protein
MGKQRKLVEAVAYLRTSSSTNAGPDKDSDKRQRAAITAFAKTHGYTVVDEFYDAAVSGADPIAERPASGGCSTGSLAMVSAASCVHGAVPAPSRPLRTLFGEPRWSLFRNGNQRSPQAPTQWARSASSI